MIGLLVAVVSLAWHIITWRYEGAKVKVVVRTAFPVLGAELGEHLRLVEALNVGRSAVEVVGWGIELGGGRSIPDMQPFPASTPLPHTLAGGHKASFYIPNDPVQRAIREQGATGRARAYVSLGNGKRMFSQKLRDN